MRGKIDYVHQEEGWGFIVNLSNLNSPRTYFEKKAVQGAVRSFPRLKRGARVEFKLDETTGNRGPIAKSVVLLKRGKTSKTS